jgi:hypothetical protein
MAENDIFELAAMRAARDPFFLGHDLREYRDISELDDEGLARFLECSKEGLMRLALCRRPDPGKASFRPDVEQIALHCGASTQKLAALVREVDAVRTMRGAPQLQAPLAQSRSALLMAARDRRLGAGRRKSAKKRRRK